jgi:hypothetical protein
MMKQAWVTVTSLLAIGAAGCSIREARIALSPAIQATTEPLMVTGLGVGRGGTFVLQGVEGSFSRGADRLGVLDPLLVSRTGGGRFSHPGSPTLPNLSGRCQYSQGDLTVGPISVRHRRMVYRCDISGAAGTSPGVLELRDPGSAFGTLHGREERLGFITLDGVRIELESLHHDAGGGLPSPLPLGYRMTSEGREVGVISFGGTGRTIYAPRSGRERTAVIAAGLALAVLWDPAREQE